MDTVGWVDKKIIPQGNGYLNRWHKVQVIGSCPQSYLYCCFQLVNSIGQSIFSATRNHGEIVNGKSRL